MQINGIINVYKEKGYTSHDVVAKLRGILHQKKIGHTGTLDPDAEGVLPVCLGKGTKVCELLTDKDKTYVAELLLGVETDTLDTSGKVLKKHEVAVTKDEVRAVVWDFCGTYLQIPPMYSARKVNGKKLYELARAGIEIEREAREVTIHDIHILDIQLPVVTFEVTCSKGTYVRSLCKDIGDKLGCGGCMQRLIRTRVERFDIKQSLRLEQIQNLVEENAIDKAVLSIDDVFDACEKVITVPEEDAPVHNGNACRCHGRKPVTETERIRLYDSSEQFVGIYEWNNIKRTYVLVKMFWDGQA